MQLPSDILEHIALINPETYRLMLHVPPFARRTVRNNVYYRRHFTILTTAHRYQQQYTLMGLLHRDDDLPAVTCTNCLTEDSNCYKCYKLTQCNDNTRCKLHAKCDICPSYAFRCPQCSHNCCKCLISRAEWFRHGERHRDGDKPAIVWLNNSEEYWHNGRPHRDGGKPAFIQQDGYREWWIDGQMIDTRDRTA
jgi:hypothetical protein